MGVMGLAEFAWYAHSDSSEKGVSTVRDTLGEKKMKKPLIHQGLIIIGGERGIRTPVGREPPTDFESGPFSLSGISPNFETDAHLNRANFSVKMRVVAA